MSVLPPPVSALETDPTLHCLSLLHLVCYSANMAVAELLYPLHIDLLTYTLLKHVVGHSFCLLFPVIVMIMKGEFRQEMGRVLKESAGSRKDLSKEEKLEEIGKEMLNMSS